MKWSITSNMIILMNQMSTIRILLLCDVDSAQLVFPTNAAEAYELFQKLIDDASP